MSGSLGSGNALVAGRMWTDVEGSEMGDCKIIVQILNIENIEMI